MAGKLREMDEVNSDRLSTDDRSPLDEGPFATIVDGRPMPAAPRAAYDVRDSHAAPAAPALAAGDVAAAARAAAAAGAAPAAAAAARAGAAPATQPAAPAPATQPATQPVLVDAAAAAAAVDQALSGADPRLIAQLNEQLAQLNAQLSASSDPLRQSAQPTAAVAAPVYIAPAYAPPAYAPYPAAYPEPQPAPLPPEKAPPTPGQRAGRFMADCLFVLMCVALVLGAALVAVSNEPGETYLGYRLYTVKTPSMDPQPGGPPGGFYSGDVILVRVVPPETLREGDIVTFVPNKANPNAFLTHRIVNIKNTLTDNPDEIPGLYFVTRGDANNANDPPISAEMVVGKKVASVRGLGSALQVVRANIAPILVCALAALAFAASVRYYFSDPGTKRKKGER
jgi:signal peptidase I